jgi:hypothetical protein
MRYVPWWCASEQSILWGVLYGEDTLRQPTAS